MERTKGDGRKKDVEIKKKYEIKRKDIKEEGIKKESIKNEVIMNENVKESI